MIPGLKRPLLHEDVRLLFTCDDLINAVCKYLDVTREELIDKTRKENIVYARHIIIYLLCNYSDLTLQVIANSMGLKSWTSAVHARDRIKDELKQKQHPRYEADVKTILQKLGIWNGV